MLAIGKDYLPSLQVHLRPSILEEKAAHQSEMPVIIALFVASRSTAKVGGNKIFIHECVRQHGCSIEGGDVAWEALISKG